MSLLTTCTDFNRVIDEALATTLDRRLVKASEGSIYDGSSFALDYIAYTRTRTKRYHYVGLTEAAAVENAKTIRKGYRRLCYKWKVFDRQRAWHRPTVTYNENESIVFHVNAAVVTPVPREGHVWEVHVQVNESITIPYRPEHANGVYPASPETFFLLEEDPDLATSAFYGPMYKVKDPLTLIESEADPFSYDL